MERIGKVFGVALAGLRHDHAFALSNKLNAHNRFKILGAFEENEEARLSAEKKGITCNYTSYEALLSDKNIEIVALGGCFGDRGIMIIRALEAGKHVIVDKPICTTTEQLNRIEALSKERKRVVMCMFSLRYTNKIATVKKIVEDGVLGEINNVYIGGQHPLTYERRPAWYFEPGKHGGTINDIAIHGIDLLSYMLGLKIIKVNAARCWNKYADLKPDFKDSAQFMLTAENGAGILGDVSYSIPDGVEYGLPYYWQFFVWGTKGTLRFSIGEDIICYVKENKNPIELDNSVQSRNYLDDFLDMLDGEEGIILTQKEVFASTRATLMIQEAADGSEKS